MENMEKQLQELDEWIKSNRDSRELKRIKESVSG